MVWQREMNAVMTWWRHWPQHSASSNDSRPRGMSALHGSYGPFPGACAPSSCSLYARTSTKTTLKSTCLPSSCTKISSNFNSSKRWIEYGADVNFESFDHNGLPSVMADVEDSDSVTRYALTSEEDSVSKIGVTGN